MVPHRRVELRLADYKTAVHSSFTRGAYDWHRHGDSNPDFLGESQDVLPVDDVDIVWYVELDSNQHTCDVNASDNPSHHRRIGKACRTRTDVTR